MSKFKRRVNWTYKFFAKKIVLRKTSRKEQIDLGKNKFIFWFQEAVSEIQQIGFRNNKFDFDLTILNTRKSKQSETKILRVNLNSEKQFSKPLKAISKR